MAKSKKLKFSVLIQGYGGECYIGSVAREDYEFFKAKQIDLDQYANCWDDIMFKDVPQEHRIFSPGSPYDCDNLAHASGATMDEASYITVLDEENNTVWESNLDIEYLKKQGVQVELTGDDYNFENAKSGQVIFWGGQGEKGCFFDAEILLAEAFDPSKLVISYTNADGWLLSSGVTYAGEELSGYDGYSTTGKWAEYKFLIAGGEEVYEGVERDEDIEEDDEEDTSESACDSEWDPVAELDKIILDESMYSPWYKGTVKPLREGTYQVEFKDAAWPWPTTDMCEWRDGKWQVYEGLKIKQWRGLNQPAE